VDTISAADASVGANSGGGDDDIENAGEEMVGHISLVSSTQLADSLPSDGSS